MAAPKGWNQPNSGSPDNPRSVEAIDVSGQVYARNFEGEGLASKIENAQAWLQANQATQGRIRVTPKPDGSAWVWDKDFSTNPFEDGNLHLDIENNVVIEYPGSGWAITVNAGGQFDKDRKSVTVEGGVWLATTDSANGEMGCFRGIDLGNSKIAPKYIDFDAPVNADTHGIRLENLERWSEMNRIAPDYVNADFPVGFIGATFNPEYDSEIHGGTNSFQGQLIQGAPNLHCNQIGIDCLGNFQYSKFDNPQVFLFEDGAHGFRFDSGGERNWGFTISGGKTEEHASNTTSFLLGSGFDGFNDLPTLEGGFYEHPTNMLSEESGASNAKLHHALAGKNAYEFRAYESDNIDIASLYYDTVDQWQTFSVGQVETQRTGNSGEPAYLLGEGGAGLYTDGTNLFFVNESGSTEQLTTL